MSRKKPTPRPRTYARNRAISRRGYEKLFESDGEYFLKLVMCVVLSTFWIKFSQPFSWAGFTFSALPLGLLIGLVIVSRFERFQADRKIWYAVLVVMGIISYFVPAGIVI